LVQEGKGGGGKKCSFPSPLKKFERKERLLVRGNFQVHGPGGEERCRLTICSRAEEEEKKNLLWEEKGKQCAIEIECEKEGGYSGGRGTSCGVNFQSSEGKRGGTQIAARR